MENPATNTIVHRYVQVSCPTGRHERSLVTFRNHTVAAMFCIPCELAWTESTEHPNFAGSGSTALWRDPIQPSGEKSCAPDPRRPDAPLANH